MFDRLQAVAAKLGPLCEQITFQMSPALDESEIRPTEIAIGRRLPAALREFFCSISGNVELEWTLKDECVGDLPMELAEVTYGLLHLDVGVVQAQWFNWCGWRNSFGDPAGCDQHGLDFSQLFPLFTTDVGNLIVIVDSGEEMGRIVYLDHERGRLDRAVLADTFDHFMSTWISLGCPGPDGALLQPFYDFEAQRLSATCRNARSWRSTVGLTN